MKQMRVTFRQARVEQEVADALVNEAFDILFMEVVRRIQKRKLHKSFSNNISTEGGDYVWAS